MISLISAEMAKRGLNWRKQLDFLPIWTERAATVVDLSCDEQRVEIGSLAADLACRNEFLFPAADLGPLRQFKPFAPVWIVVPRGDVFYESFARRLAATLPPGVEIADDSTEPVGDALILGHSGQNRISARLAGRQLLHANGLIPGAGGFYWQTLYEPDRTLAVAVADAASADAAFAWFRANGHGNVTVLGETSRRRLGSPEELLRSMALRISRLGEPAATFEGMTREIIRSFDSGGKAENRDNGHTTLPNIVRIHSAYCYSGDRRFLEVFRETLLGLTDYFLKTPGGASYPADYDFYLGNLINAWSQAESDPIFSEGERALITAFLLASVRLIERYQQRYWPLQGESFRFNHETFPALSLAWAAEYFGAFYHVPEAGNWREHAARTFSGQIATGYRQLENSNSYQWLVPSQKLCYDLSRSPESPDRTQLARTVEAIRVTTDSLGGAVPFGDAEPFIGTVAQLDLLRFAAATGDRNAQILYSQNCAGLLHEPFLHLPHPGWGNFFAPAEAEPATEPAVCRWELLPLAEHVHTRHHCRIPAERVFEKIAFRSGWNREAQYLLFEPYSCDMHAHFDMNSILSYCHLGRWGLVDNGYGKPCGVNNAEEAYNRRQTGPDCHNTLLFFDRDDQPVIPPPFCEVTGIGNSGKEFRFESTLRDIRGAVWRRRIVLTADDSLLVEDLVEPGDGISRVECQFNALGTLRPSRPGQWTLEQQGVSTILEYHGDGVPTEREYLTQGYAAILGKEYPFAAGPIHRLSRTVDCANRQRIFFSTRCRLVPTGQTLSNRS